MRNFKFYLSMIAVSALLFTTSCSTDDPAPDPGPEEPQMVTLSFNGALQQFSKAMATKQSEAENPIPACSENNTPTYVEVGLKEDSDGDGDIDGDDAWVTGGAITIGVIIPATDSDDDGATNYLTFESADLELPAGEYCLEYFGVYNSDDELIWLAPSEDDTYGPANFENFVEDALPICIDLEVGTKHYVEVEVLCYDEHYAREYGYLFFDFEEVPLTYVCFFANICNEWGYHFPGEIRVMAWMAGVDYNEDNLLVDKTNEVERNEAGEVTYAAPVCIPLPDRDGEDLYHIVIVSLDADGNATPLYTADLTDTEIEALLNPDGDEQYIHIRGADCLPPVGDDCQIDTDGDGVPDCNDDEDDNPCWDWDWWKDFDWGVFN